MFDKQKQHVQGLPKSGMGVIQANPDQSKHLETATLRLCGLPIDLVHLRSETYTKESRIPTIEVGTPEEDARRRDFTVNSLFYNINLQKVEDFTSMGLDDLKSGVIRTPLDAQVTFLDGMYILFLHTPSIVLSCVLQVSLVQHVRSECMLLMHETLPVKRVRFSELHMRWQWPVCRSVARASCSEVCIALLVYACG